MDKISNHFPPNVRDQLVEASKIDEGLEISEKRIEAIDEVIGQARMMYPKLFRFKRANPPMDTKHQCDE